MTYDHEYLAAMRAIGESWGEIAGRHGHDPKQLRQAHSRWLQRRADVEERTSESTAQGRVVQEWRKGPEGTEHVKYPEAEGMNIQDLSRAFWDSSMAAFDQWQPQKEAPPVHMPRGDGTNLAVLSLYDAHFGMKADAEEIGPLGEHQDLKIAARDFDAVASGLVSLSRMYWLERYLLPIGHDFSHVNQYMGKALTTRSGTEQDVDSRLWKIHRAVCRSAVKLIDTARSTGKPVDVVMVPGNHDPDENFKLGEFLKAWFRHDDGVTVTNTPTMHKYYGWQDNAFMLTHGEHYMKKNAAANPILTFSVECPPEIWARGYRGGRWVLSGHLHARRKGQYTPTSDVQEEKGVVAYVLPGLTATDDWHQRNGYRHNRAATLQVFRADGSLAGLHEVAP